jgi:hypothetical protein
MLLVIGPIHLGGQTQLAEIVDTTDPTRRDLALTQCRQEHRGDNGDDSDDHQ